MKIITCLKILIHSMKYKLELIVTYVLSFCTYYMLRYSADCDVPWENLCNINWAIIFYIVLNRLFLHFNKSYIWFKKCTQIYVISISN